MKFPIILIGAGHMGRIHAANVGEIESFELRYVVDSATDLADSLAAATGARAVPIEEALDDRDLAGAVIASATDTHSELVAMIASRGIAIFCEKPLDLSVNRAKFCVAAVERHAVPFVLGFNRRYDPDFAALQALTSEGGVGNVESVHIVSRDLSSPQMDYVKKSGGLFKDMMIHDIDVARWLLPDEPVEVTACGSNVVDPEIGRLGDIDSAFVTLRTQSGRLCSIANSRRNCYGYDQRVEVHGSEGTVRIRNSLESALVVMDGRGARHANPLRFFNDRYATAYQLEMAHFAAVVAGSEAPRSTVFDGLRALEIAEAASVATEERKTVMVDIPC